MLFMAGNVGIEPTLIVLETSVRTTIRISYFTIILFLISTTHLGSFLHALNL